MDIRLMGILMLAVNIPIALIAWVLWFFPTPIEWADTEINWGYQILLLAVIYTVKSFDEVGTSDVGVLTFFGKAITQVGPGLAFVPLWLCKLPTFSNLTQQAELPAEPELIYRGSDMDKDGKNVPKGKFAPIRITFGHPESPNVDPYDQRMVAEVTPVIRYRINDAVKFIQTIGSWENARIQIEDAVVAVLNEEFSQITPAKALTKLGGEEGINKKLEREIDDLLKSWGVDLESIRIKPFGFSHDLNQAVLEVPKAERAKEASIIAASGQKQVNILTGQGEAAQKAFVLNAETAALSRRAEKLGVSGQTVLGMHTAREVTNNPGQKTVIAGSGGFADLAAIGTVVGETLTTKGGSTT